jgi:RNA-binding protein
MLTSKERAVLRAEANGLSAIFHLGKQGLSPEFTEGIREALEARELIKLDLLQNCELEPKEVAQIISERTGSEIVQVIGRKIVLYKKSKSKKEGKTL